MSQFLPYIITGLVTGSVYGLAGTGLVLTFKTSGIFNFAYGAIAAMGVFVFYWLNVQEGLPWGLAAAICVRVLAPAEGLLLELLGRALEDQGTAVKVVATVGLLLIVGFGVVVLGVLAGVWWQVDDLHPKGLDAELCTCSFERAEHDRLDLVDGGDSEVRHLASCCLG